MFNKISHLNGPVSEDEILFSTPFDYFFPEAARSTLCLLPQAESTTAALKQLGTLMADPGEIGDPQTTFDSQIPAIYTYFGQFIDHDITARTDRDGDVTTLGRAAPVAPIDPDIVVDRLRNGRRPQLDLDNVFGDGPGLSGTALAAVTQSQTLYDSSYQLVVFEDGDRVDVPRDSTHRAIIADMRNDENVNVSQIQAAFLTFFNAVHAQLPGGDDRLKYIRARQLVRWAYQFAVVNDYLMTVCDPAVVTDTLANGPRFLGAGSGRGGLFMPLEFSVAAFRFAHSMIRPFYALSATSGEIGILDLLEPAKQDSNFDSGDGQLIAARIIDWDFFVGTGSNVQMARKIDSRLARGLFSLARGFGGSDPVLSHLARSNLLRGYNLSIPTGQATCDAFGITPLTATELKSGESPDIAALLADSYFDQRSPLWYYVLREATVQQSGDRLGELGSRLVAETIIGLLKSDPNSYLNNTQDAAVDVDNGIDVTQTPGGVLANLIDILQFTGVF